MISVVFIHSGGEEMASYRYRAKIPCQELNKLGVKASINGGEAHAAIFSKPIARDLELAKSFKSQGCKIITDMGDNHFNHPQLGPVYQGMLELADIAVCPTPVMAEIQSDRGAKTVVIPDPYELPESAPHATGENLLWFGHHINLPDLDKFRRYQPTIVTGPQETPETITWSSQALSEAMKQANIALFPARQGSEYKSPNRLLNALRAGLFPVCSRHPAYEAFKPFCWIGDVHTGIRWARHFKDDLNDLVKQGQAHIRDKYSPETIGRQWKDLFESI